MEKQLIFSQIDERNIEQHRQLIDEFIDFNDSLTFWCDSISSLLLRCEGLEDSSKAGAIRQAEQLKRSLEALKSNLEEFRNVQTS